MNKLSCDLCKREVITENDMQCDLTDNYQYLSAISRGGLKWPTDFLVEVVTQVFIVFRGPWLLTTAFFGNLGGYVFENFRYTASNITVAWW